MTIEGLNLGVYKTADFNSCGNFLIGRPQRIYIHTGKGRSNSAVQHFLPHTSEVTARKADVVKQSRRPGLGGESAHISG